MVKRELYLERIRPFYDSEMIKVLTGIRRCGKSTLMLQMIEEIRQHGAADDHIIYINFENYKYKKLCAPDALYEYVENEIKDDARYYLFIDEIQNVPDFEPVVNSFRATHNISIFITGSNSKLLSGELATHLSGRTLSFRIMPFCFKEYVAFCEEAGMPKPVDQLLDEYMQWGGFPLVCKEPEADSKEVLLSNIYDSVVLKDVVMRNKIASVTALEKILEYVIGNSSLTISGSTIAAALKADDMNISVPTVYDYLKYISDACICDKVPRYDIRGKKVLAFEEKTYVCDPGFFHLKKNRVKEEYSHIIETICYNELIARGYQVYVGKTYKGEVDFIAQKGSEKFYVQAAYLLDSESTAEREFGAYRSIEDNFPKYVVSTDRITMSRDGIIHMNLGEWLMR